MGILDGLLSGGVEIWTGSEMLQLAAKSPNVWN